MAEEKGLGGSSEFFVEQEVLGNIDPYFLDAGVVRFQYELARKDVGVVVVLDGKGEAGQLKVEAAVGFAGFELTMRPKSLGRQEFNYIQREPGAGFGIHYLS